MLLLPIPISSNLLNDVTYLCICAGNCVSSIRTNRARCALYKKILDLLDEERNSNEHSISTTFNKLWVSSRYSFYKIVLLQLVEGKTLFFGVGGGGGGQIKKV